MRKILVAIIVVILASGCASPTHLYEQLPLELRVIHVESSRANLPREMFTGPMPPPAKAKAIPGMMEAIAVIAQAISNSFKYGFESASFQSEHAAQHGFIRVDIFSILWGEKTEPAQSAQMWAEYDKFLDKLPQSIPMYGPHPEDIRTRSQQFMGWSDKPSGSVTLIPTATPAVAD